MYFMCDETGRILICAIEQIKPEMVWMDAPEGFLPEDMHNWRAADGALIYDPVPVEKMPTANERIAALEEELLAAKILLGLEA